MAHVIKTGGTILNQSNAAQVQAYVYVGLTSHEMYHWALQWIVTASTITLAVANNKLTDGQIDDITLAQLEACDWVDQTSERTGSATQTTTGSYMNDEEEAFYLLRIGVLPTNATNACKLIFNGRR